MSPDLAVSRTVAFRRFTTMLRELSRAFPGFQPPLRRGTVAEVTEQGTADLQSPVPSTDLGLASMPL